MPIIRCHDCGSDNSTDASRCLKCGAILKTATNRIKRVGRIIWYLVCALILAIVFRSCYMAGDRIVAVDEAINKANSK